MSKKHSITYLWDGTPLDKSDEIHIELHLLEDGISIQIDAPYYGDPAPECSSSSTWGLWEYEVFEVFFVGEDGQYLEAEFGPHGHHLLLWLNAPRTIEKKHLPVNYSSTIQQDRWCGVAHLSHSILPSKIQRWNLFSIHGTGIQRQYQCMHPLDTPKPDFHQPKRFPLFPEIS